MPPDPLSDPGAATAPAPGAFLPPPGSIPLDKAPRGVIAEPPGTTVGGAAKPVSPLTTVVAAPSERRSWGFRVYAGALYGLSLLLLALLLPAWLSALGEKGVDKNTAVKFGPSSDVMLSEFIQLLQAAEKEIMVAARFVNNPEILQALVDRQQVGVSVLVLLTREEKSSATTAEWLIKHNFPQSRLFFDTSPLTSQLVVIDHKTVVTGNLPFNTKMVSSSGDLLVLNNPRLAKEYRTHLERRVRASLAAP